MATEMVGITLESAGEQAAAAIAAMPIHPKTTHCHICEWVGHNYAQLITHYEEHHPDCVIPVTVTLNVNGKRCMVIIEPQLTLKQVLQLHLGLYGAKEMCDRGACGSCTVIIDGKPALSCNILAAQCEGKTIETIEGIAVIPKWKPLIDAYCKWDAMQCGYCTPGFLVTAKALLDKNPNPTEREINEALSGNICICGTYPRHSQSIIEAVKIMANAKSMVNAESYESTETKAKVDSKASAQTNSADNEGRGS